MQGVLFGIALVVALIGLAGTVVPFLPGIPLIFAGIIGYGWYEGFHQISGSYAAVMGALAVLSVLVDYGAAAVGTALFGASRQGALAAGLGGIAGLIVAGPLGMLFGPWIAAFLVEYILSGDASGAARAGLGAVIGLLSGTAVQFLLGMAMVISFVIKAIPIA